MTAASTHPATVLRSPKRADAPALHRLVLESEALEANTCYAYLLLATDFAATSVVAEEDGEVVGFVAAYRPPPRPDAVFVWQIGVAAKARGRGLARRLLEALVALPACADVHFLEATVGTSNVASQRLFTAAARALGVPCRRETGFVAADFGDSAHEDEERFRIGPLSGRGALPEERAEATEDQR
jgi:L-2,4-diaminobutyric acid acetyltransferase